MYPKTGKFSCLFFAFHVTITVLVVISEGVATQIAYIFHPQTIYYRLSTIGAKKTVPVFLGQRLNNFGNPGQRQHEWGRENSLMEQQNSKIPISGMIFRSKIS
jgi:hypothetical protein